MCVMDEEGREEELGKMASLSTTLPPPHSQSPKPPLRSHPLLTRSRLRLQLHRLSPRSLLRTAKRQRAPPSRRMKRRALRRKSECHKRVAACACFATVNAAIFHSDSTFICLYDPYLCWIKSRLLLSWFWRYNFFFSTTPPPRTT